jgi:hypothetical protein
MKITGKTLFREKKICKMHLNGVEWDEWLVIDLSLSHYVLCDIVELRCWQVPKPLLKQFMSQFYRAEKIEVHCPS